MTPPADHRALLELLDDPSPVVRAALLKRFQELGPDGVGVLRATVAGEDRHLSRHAAGILRELRESDPVSEFVAFVRSLQFELETGSILLARTVNPQLDPAAVCTRLDALGRRARELIVEPASIREKCRVLNRVLFHEEGLTGNHENYADPLNSLLDQVLTRKRGIPITLAIVYLLVAERAGIEGLHPIGMPGHFLVGCFSEAKPFYIDAFHQGAFRTVEELHGVLRENNIIPRVDDLAPTPVRAVLARCCRNLVRQYEAAGDGPRTQQFKMFLAELEAAAGDAEASA